MPDVAPLGCTHQSPLRFSVPPSVPHGGWATCGGRSPGSRLERFSPTFPVAQREPPVAYAEETCRLQLREQPRSWRVVPHRVPIFIGCARDAHNRNRRTLRAPERRLDVNAKAAAPSATGTSDTVLQHSPHGHANCEFQHEKRLCRAYAADARRKTAHADNRSGTLTGRGVRLATRGNPPRRRWLSCRSNSSCDGVYHGRSP